MVTEPSTFTLVYSKLFFSRAMYYFNFWESSEPLESETSAAVPNGTLSGALQPIGKDSVWHLDWEDCGFGGCGLVH